MHKLDTMGWTAKWALKLTEFDLVFRSRSFIKVQVLEDFVTERTNSDKEPMKADSPAK